jgi:hypothetical protein
VGIAVDDGPVASICDDDEGDLLCKVWEVINAAANITQPVPGTEVKLHQIVGHNIRFDAGFLVRRSWVNDVPVPGIYTRDLYDYRPRYWRDTMAAWALGDRQCMISLKAMCGAFGIQVKDGPVTGKTFGEWWGRDRDLCIAYNRQDVEAVRELWQRVGGV